MKKQYRDTSLKQATPNSQMHLPPIRKMQSLSVVTGTEGNDYLQGTSVPDTINGLSSDDFIEGRGGVDRIDGGNGYGEEAEGDQLVSVEGAIGSGSITTSSLLKSKLVYNSSTTTPTITSSFSITGKNSFTNTPTISKTITGIPTKTSTVSSSFTISPTAVFTAIESLSSPITDSASNTPTPSETGTRTITETETKTCIKLYVLEAKEGIFKPSNKIELILGADQADTVSYENSTRSVNVDLSMGRSRSSDAERDVFKNINNG